MKNWGRHEYGKLYDEWPKREDGEPESPAYLWSCSPLDLEAQTLQSMLESFGIPSICLAPGDGQFGKLILGMSGTGLDIYVPESRLEEAKEIMEGEPEDGTLDE